MIADPQNMSTSATLKKGCKINTISTTTCFFKKGVYNVLWKYAVPSALCPSSRNDAGDCVRRSAMPRFVRVRLSWGEFAGWFHPNTGMIVGDRDVKVHRAQVEEVLEGSLDD